ncbi:MAG: HAD-IIIC family phosphatase [Acidimicrobiia bacterium]
MTVPSEPAFGPSSDLTELLRKARSSEVPLSAISLALGRKHYEEGDYEQALEWCLRVTDGGDSYQSWYGAAQLLPKILEKVQPNVSRTLRLAVLGSYTTNQLTGLLRLMALRRGIHLEIYEAGYNQYQQEILDESSSLYLSKPEVVLVAVDQHEVGLPTYSDDPEEAIDNELQRWTTLWDKLGERTDATIVQTDFVVPGGDPFGNLSRRLRGSRSSMLEELNRRLSNAADERVMIASAERLASQYGKNRWHDPRYWVLAKQAVSLDALPLLARHLSAVIAASLGLTRKCLVVDLDGTLWGGVIGEDGLGGIKLGPGAEGEAFVAFQDYLLSLKERGVILAVCSKNDEATAKEPFEQHPDMRIKLEDLAAFVANWEPKSKNLSRIAQSLDLSTDALTFVDDQPAERAAVRAALPEVDVIQLPPDPAYFVSTLSSYPFFETMGYTNEDRNRASQYRARALLKEAEAQASSLEDFLLGLEMEAIVADFDELHLNRIVQLIGKTNQFNLTSRRHSRATVEKMMDDPAFVCFYLKLSDRLADHGLVGVVIGEMTGDAIVIDTMLMSCRVIGRTAETTMLDHIFLRGAELGAATARGIYVPSAKNGQVADLYARHGFGLITEAGDQTTWEFPLTKRPDPNPLIEVASG